MSKMRTSALYTVFVFVLLVVINISCTRKQEESAQLSIPIPHSLGTNQKAGSLSVENLFHIVVNVHNAPSGGGIIAVYNWDACDSGGCSGNNYTAPPTSITLDLPKGSNRLVQLLAVYKSDAGGMSFRYADAVVNMSNNVSSVTLAPQPIGGGTSSTEGRMSGRYIMADGTKPTGQVLLQLNPPNGRPQMLITAFGMVAGYFDAFYVDGAGLTYYMPKYSHYLFGNTPFNSSSLTYDSKLVKVHVPSYYRSEGDSNSSNVRAEDGGTAVIGFFGPGATGTVCYPNASATAVNSIYPNPDLSGAIYWNGSGAGTSSNVYPIAGGSSASSCSASNYTSLISIVPSNFSDGVYSASGIEAPFLRSPNSNLINITSSSSSTTFSWSYISATQVLAPSAGGVTTGAIDSVEILYKHGGKSLVEVAMIDHDAVDCDRLNSMGFASARPTTVATQTVTIPGVTSSDLSNLGMVYCPKAQGQYLFGKNIRYYSSGSSLKMMIAGSLTVDMSANTCTPYSLSIVDGAGNLATPSSSTDVSLSISSSATTVFSDAGCSSSIISTGTSVSTVQGSMYYLPTESSKNIYIKKMDSGYIDLAVAPTNFMSATAKIGVVLSGSTLTNLSMAYPSATVVNKCYPFTINREAVGGIPTLDGGALAVGLNLKNSSTSTDASDGLFYANKDCTGTGASATTLTFDSSLHALNASFKPIGNSGSRYVYYSGTISGNNAYMNFGDDVLHGFTIHTSGPNGNSVINGQCTAAWFEGTNSAGAKLDSLPAETLVFSVTSGTLGLHAQNNCSDGSTTSRNINTQVGHGQTQSIYLLNPSAGPSVYSIQFIGSTMTGSIYSN